MNRLVPTTARRAVVAISKGTIMNATAIHAHRYLITAAALMAAIAGGALHSSASAYDTYTSGTGVGRHQDARVSCANSPYRTLQATPLIGTTVGWERGQNVAWRYHVKNISTGQLVVREQVWRTARIATIYTTTDVLGNTVTHADHYATLPSTTWSLAAGKYQVYVDYAWQTSRGWSYSQSLTTQYSNQYTLYGIWWTYGANTCDVDVIGNRYF